MANRRMRIQGVVFTLIVCVACLSSLAQEAAGPDKVYVPYEKLKSVFESDKQGVFLPYDEFRKLWQAAQAAPAGVGKAPAPYLISTGRFTGKVGDKLATMQLELTVDILADGWVETPIALGEVAVANVSFVKSESKARPLLRVVKGQYRLLTKGRGRHVLRLDFVRQLVTETGLNVLKFRIPRAAITTLELVIPEENMKVDVKPMLAATTTQATVDKVKSTRVQAFLGSVDAVELSWKPKTQAAAELAPVIIARQFQHIHVAEALISHDVTFTYDIRRRGVDSFTIQLPPGFRVTAVEGANISKEDIPAAGKDGPQNLQVKLFSPVKGKYELTVKMERFLKEDRLTLPLSPILTQQALRRRGLIAITHSPRRSVELSELRNLARVDTARLPKSVRGRTGVTAYRFIMADYGGRLAIATVAPRITARHYWTLGVHADRLELHGSLDYTVERAGVFELTIGLPEPWEVTSVGPSNIVADHNLVGEGADQKLVVLLKKELTGALRLDLRARAPRDKADQAVDFTLPMADAKHLKLHAGQLVLRVAGELQAQVEQLDQLHSLSLAKAVQRRGHALAAAMAFEFRTIDRARPAGAKFKISARPTQISAVVHRLEDIQPGAIRTDAVVRYQVRYAPVDTFYLKMPAALADDVQIAGDPDGSKPGIKEKPRIEALPDDQAPAGAPAPAEGEAKWAYFKIVLQEPVIGQYDVRVTARRSFQAGADGQAAKVTVGPILAAGKLADQSGHVAIAKAETLAILDPVSKGLTPADPSSPVDVPYAPHRSSAALAFRYSAPPFELALSVVTQKEAAVFTTIANAAIIEQNLAPDGTLHTRAVYILATSRGDRLTVTLPEGAKPYEFLLNGSGIAMALGATERERVVLLPPSAGQVVRFVLDISYGLEGASAGALAAPALPADVPVQQTLWRAWLPADDYVLAYDRNFSSIDDYQAVETLAAMVAGAPVEVTFGPRREGRLWNFVRTGAATQLSVTLVDKKWFNIAVWVLVLAAGAAMLKLGGFRRCMAILLAAVAAIAVNLFAPLFIARLTVAAAPAGIIVMGLWIAHWIFEQRGDRLKATGPAPPPAAEPKPAKAKDEPAQTDEAQDKKGQ